MTTLIFSFIAVVLAVVIAGVFSYMGFAAGRQVAEKPIQPAASRATMGTGEPVLDEYDAYEEALRGPGIDADVKIRRETE